VCGIGGILCVWPAGAAVSAPSESIPESWLDIIDESIKHRGPDGQGRFRDRVRRADGSTVDVALVHRRLSILDHAGGAQPMVSEQGRPGLNDGRVTVVFNGCIYNHRELRKELQGRGHTFVTDHSDTEVLIHGWREWGLGAIHYCDLCDVRAEGLCSRLDGMFAFAIWDGRAGSVTLGRDQHGEKPLYMCSRESGERGPRLYAFASTASGLLRWSRLVGLERPGFLDEWVQEGYSPMAWSVTEVLRCGTETLGINRGEEGGLRPRAQYEPAGSQPIDVEGLKAAWERTSNLRVDQVDRLLDEAVRGRLEADVPLGSFLSGGVDSSLVAHYARRALGKLATFTVRMPEPAYDESEHAEKAAKIIGTDHTTLSCETRPAEDLASLICQLGLPFGDSSLLPTYWVSRATRGHVKVALSGDGGDELFAGYERYQAATILSRWGWLLRLLPARAFKDADPKSRSSKARRLVEAARGRGYADLRSIFPRVLAAKLGLRSWPPPFRGTGRGAVERAISSDLEDYLPGDLMRKSDTASMSVALEVRAPLLSNGLTGAARTATIKSLMPMGMRKGLLRQVARKHLPPEIVDRPKMGFAIPVGQWFRSDYGGMKTMLMDHLRSAEPWPNFGVDLNRGFVDQMVGEHMEERRDHSQRLYMLLVLSIWSKAFLV
jgi:asparagine synthase (glutamine-hydrolysing)